MTLKNTTTNRAVENTDHGNVYRGGGKRYTPEQREAAFWAKVAKGTPDVCWPWRGAVTTHGYGCFSRGHGKSVIGAHKAAYQYAKGEVPAGMEIMHACDTPICCNPSHLSLGTRQDNIADRVSKGRSHRLGVVAKLTADQVVEIRSLRGVVSSGELARRFHVTQPHIINLWNRKTWRQL